MHRITVHATWRPFPFSLLFHPFHLPTYFVGKIAELQLLGSKSGRGLVQWSSSFKPLVAFCLHLGCYRHEPLDQTVVPAKLLKPLHITWLTYTQELTHTQYDWCLWRTKVDGLHCHSCSILPIAPVIEQDIRRSSFAGRWVECSKVPGVSTKLLHCTRSESVTGSNENTVAVFQQPESNLCQVGWLPHSIDPTESDNIRPVGHPGLSYVS